MPTPFRRLGRALAAFTRLDRLFAFRSMYQDSRASRARLEVSALEERIVLNGTLVSAEWLADAAEPGTTGTIRFTRAADQTEIDANPLIVSFLTTGSATPGTDFVFVGASAATPTAGQPLTVTLAPGQSVLDLSVQVIDDTEAEGWESVTVAIQEDAAYTIDSEAGDSVTVWIADNELWLEADADPVLKGQEVTFWLPEDAPEFTAIEWDANYDGTTFQPVAGANDYWFALTYSTVGSRTVAARVTAADESVQIVTLSVTVEAPPPDLTVPDDLTATVGVPVAFDVQATVDGAIASVGWALAYETEDGWEYEELPDLAGLDPEYTFDDPGEYWFRVLVTDTNGKSSEGWFLVTVDGAAPTATVAVSGPTDEGQPVTFTLTDFDPARLPFVTVWVNWTGAEDEFGDGIFEALGPGALTVHPDGSITFTHVYNAPGADTTFDAVVWLEDEWGQGTEYPLAVTVRDLRPTVDLVAGGRRTVVAFQGTTYLDLRALMPGEPLRLENVQVAATENLDHVTFLWEIDGTEAPNTNAPILVLPDQHPGKVYRVRAWVTDGGGTASVVQEFTAAIDGASGPSGGPVRLNGPLYGTASITEVGAAEHYGRFHAMPLVVRTNWDANVEQVTVRTQIEESTRRFAQALGATVQYTYLVSVYDVEEHTWPFPPNHILRWAGQITPGTVDGGAAAELLLNAGLPPEAAMWAFHTDREINVLPVLSLVLPDGTVIATMTLATVRVLTLKTGTTWQQVVGTFQAIESLVSQLADRGQTLLNAVTANPDRVLNALLGGFTQGLRTFATDLVTPTLPDGSPNPNSLMNQLYNWLAGGSSNLIAALNGVNFNNADTLKNFVLQYAGLTVENVQTVVRQQLGAGNLAALDTVLGWFQNSDGSGAPITDANELLDNIKTRIGAELEGDPLAGLLDPATLFADAKGALEAKLKEAGTRLAAQIAAKFVPGAGAILGVYNIAKWVIDNQGQLGGLFNSFLQSIDALAEADPTAAVATRVREGLTNAVPMLLGAMAAQFGLGNFPNELRQALGFVPAKVNGLLAAAVGKVAAVVVARLPGGRSGLPDKIVATKPFTYPEVGGKDYLLYAYQDTPTTVKVEIAEKLSGGGWRRLADQPLDAKVFTAKVRVGGDGKSAKQHITEFAAAAKAVSEAARARYTPGSAQAQGANALLEAKRAAYTAAEFQLVEDIKADACVTLSAGCFAAGTKLLTRRGWVAVEEIAEGDEVAARHESEPGGEVAWKAVEATFRRTGKVLHLHFPDGELIRTTPEHPFWIEGTGWTPAGALKEGDRITTLVGDAVPVSEVYDTGEWEVVYNVRVADFHTYFVGDQDWGFSAWAHNSYESLRDDLKLAASQANPPAFTGGLPKAIVQTLWDYAKANTHEAWYKFDSELRAKRITDATTIRNLWWSARDQDPALLAQTQAKAQQILATCVQAIKNALEPLGVTDLQFGIRGSLATGYSWDEHQAGTSGGGQGRPWDGNYFDVDAFVKSDKLTSGSMKISPPVGSKFVSLLRIDTVEGFKVGQANHAAALQVIQAIYAAESGLKTAFKGRLKPGSFTFKVFDLGASAITGLPL